MAESKRLWRCVKGKNRGFVVVSTHDRIIWQGYPAWSKFAWLYLVSVAAGARGLRILWQGATGWESWLAGALALLVCAACLRRWAQYLIISTRVVMRNGYTGKDIQTIKIEDIAEITLSQGPIARFFNIGTLVVHSKSDSSPLLLQGLRDPEIIKTRLEACRP
jgi:membrane protein YdbS with pleckstrin-like domain